MTYLKSKQPQKDWTFCNFSLILKTCFVLIYISWFPQYSTRSIKVEYCGFSCFVLKTQAEQLSNDFNVKLRNNAQCCQNRIIIVHTSNKDVMLEKFLIIKKPKLYENFSSKQFKVWNILNISILALTIIEVDISKGLTYSARLYFGFISNWIGHFTINRLVLTNSNTIWKQ